MIERNTVCSQSTRLYNIIYNILCVIVSGNYYRIDSDGQEAAPPKPYRRGYILFLLCPYQCFFFFLRALIFLKQIRNCRHITAVYVRNALTRRVMKTLTPVDGLD